MQSSAWYASLALTLTAVLSVRAEITKGVMAVRGAEMA
jgi:hypothetical protein